MKKNKKFFFTLLSVGISSLVLSSLCFFHVTKNNNNFGSVSVVHNAIPDGPETQATFKFISVEEAKKFEWYGKKKVDQITNDDIKSLLITQKSDGNPLDKVNVNFTVERLTISSEDRLNGGVRFKIIQNRKNLKDGSSEETLRTEIPHPDVTKTSGFTEDELTWSTYKMYGMMQGNFVGLGIIEKYSFKWNDDEKIAAFIKQTYSDGMNLDSPDLFTSKTTDTTKKPMEFDKVVTNFFFARWKSYNPPKRKIHH